MKTASEDAAVPADHKKNETRRRLDEIRAARLCNRYTDDVDVDWLIEELDRRLSCPSI